MSKSFLPCSFLTLLGLAACQPNDEPMALKLETSPANSILAKLPPADTLFAPFYATYQASATYRLSAIRASIQENPKADSSTLQFVYQDNQLIDKKLRPAGSDALIDLPRRLTFNQANQLILSEATATSAASQTGIYSDARTEYTYGSDGLARAVRYTRSASGMLVPAVDVTYTYLNGRYSSALIKSYIAQTVAPASSATPAPLFTYQRMYSYSADGRSLTSTDNNGLVIIDAQLDERGAILFEQQRFAIAPEGYRPVFFSAGLQDVYKYPNKASSDRLAYTYDGPDGLISEVYNRSKDIVYQFIYERK